MRMRRMLILLISVAIISTAHGKVDLVTLPSRDTVQLTIYNSADMTLVRESRALTLKDGENKLQFSWANTLSDPFEIEILPTSGSEPEIASGADETEAASLWGQAVDGIQVRIRTEQHIWKYGQIPQISVDVRNESEDDIPFDESKHLLQLQVDGKWHKLFYPKDRNRWGIKAKVLSAGQTYEGIEITCGSHWHSVRGTLTLRPFGEGGHILRVAYLGPDGMRVESRPVRIDVVHPMFDPATSSGQKLIGERFSAEDVVAYHKRLAGETLDLERMKELYLNIAMVYRAKAYHGDNLSKRLKAIQGYADEVLAESYKDEIPYVFLAGVERALALGQKQSVQLKLYGCLRDAWFYPNPARAAEVRLAALRCLLKYDDLPAKAPKAPVGPPVPSGLIVDDDELNKKIHERYERSVAATKEHNRIMRLLHWRELYTNDVIGAYRFYLERVDKSLVPEALGNLHKLAVRYLGDERVAAQFVEAVKGNGSAPAVTRTKTSLRD